MAARSSYCTEDVIDYVTGDLDISGEIIMNGSDEDFSYSSEEETFSNEIGMLIENFFMRT